MFDNSEELGGASPYVSCNKTILVVLPNFDVVLIIGSVGEARNLEYLDGNRRPHATYDGALLTAGNGVVGRYPRRKLTEVHTLECISRYEGSRNEYKMGRIRVLGQ